MARLTFEDQPRARALRLSFGMPDDDGQGNDYVSRLPNEARLDAVDTRSALNASRSRLETAMVESHAMRSKQRAHG